MSLYVRVNTNFYTSRKTAHLRSLLGNDAYWIPPRIWAYAATDQPDGNLSKYGAQVLANLIGYNGDAQRMLEALLAAGFLDDEPLRIHDWHEHNSYHVSFAERAKIAAEARWAKQRSRETGEEKRREETSIALSNATSIVELPIEIKVKPPENPSQELRRKAIEILMHLNTEASREFRVCDSHLKSIIARLVDVDGDVDGVKKMITRMCGCWKNDPEKAQYLDPDTLFRPTKFPKYYDKRNLAIVSNGNQPTHAMLKAAKEAKESRIAELKKRFYSDTQSLSGGQYIPAGWRNEGARQECVALKDEIKKLNEQLSKMV